jgi:Bardet-Biedl syndrome 2 protein
MTLSDWDEDNEDELVVGSDDFAIRVFKGEDIIFDVNEAAKINHLSTIKKNIFGFSLENGHFGVYYSRKRLWMKKGKTKVSSILGIDYQFDGQMCLAIGYENGLVEMRRHRTGEIIH